MLAVEFLQLKSPCWSHLTYHWAKLGAMRTGSASTYMANSEDTSVKMAKVIKEDPAADKNGILARKWTISPGILGCSSRPKQKDICLICYSAAKYEGIFKTGGQKKLRWWLQLAIKALPYA